MLGELLNCMCSHVPMEIFHFYEMGKKLGNQNRVVLFMFRFFFFLLFLFKFLNLFIN
jgi:hypothetical protein